MIELNYFCFGLNLCIALFCGIVTAALPFLTRKAYLFGVAVPEKAMEHPGAKQIVRRYVRRSLCGTLLILLSLVLQFLLWPDFTLSATLYFVLPLIALQLMAMIPAWRQSLRLKEQEGWSVPPRVYAETSSSHARGGLGDVLWAYYGFSLALIFASFLIALLRYPELPARIPIHFDANMVPDAWTDKSLLTVLLVPLSNLGMLLLMTAAGLSVAKSKLQISPENPALSFAQHRVYRRAMGHALGFLTLCTVTGIFLLSLSMLFTDFRLPFALIMALLGLPVLPLLIVSLGLGQGGCKVKPRLGGDDVFASGYRPQTSASSIPGRDEDKNWILGLFYWNPEDPAVLVGDRFGCNIGFNYARFPVKIGALVLGIALIALYVWLTPYML